MHRDNFEIPVFTMPLLRKRRYWEFDIDIFNGGMHCREAGEPLEGVLVCTQNMHMLPRFWNDKEFSSSVVTMST